MLKRQEELQRQDERDEILLQEELQAIEIELRRQRQRMQKSKKNGQKYQFAKNRPLAKPKQHWKKKLELECDQFFSQRTIFTLYIQGHIFGWMHILNHAKYKYIECEVTLHAVSSQVKISLKEAAVHLPKRCPPRISQHITSRRNKKTDGRHAQNHSTNSNTNQVVKNP